MEVLTRFGGNKMEVLTRQGLVDKNNGSAHPAGFDVDVGGHTSMLVDKNNGSAHPAGFDAGGQNNGNEGLMLRLSWKCWESAVETLSDWDWWKKPGKLNGYLFGFKAEQQSKHAHGSFGLSKNRKLSPLASSCQCPRFVDLN